MAIQNGSKRITKIYHGNRKVFEDSFGVWKTLDYQVNGGELPSGELKYMELKDRLIFDGFYTVTGSSDSRTISFIIPDKYKNLTLLNNLGAPSNPQMPSLPISGGLYARASINVENNLVSLSFTYDSPGPVYLYFGFLMLSYTK